MPGLSKVIVLDPDARASRQVQLGFEREGIAAAAITAEPAPEPALELLGEDTGLVVVGGADGAGIDLIRRTRSWLGRHAIDAPIVFAGRGVAWGDATAAGADEVVRHPAYLRDVVIVGRLLRGVPAERRDHLVGNLIEVTGVFTLVRALSALGRSGTLTLVRGLRRGEVRFYLGEVTSAQVGMSHGQAALHQLLLWTDARFDFHHEEVVRRQQIPLAPDELFADAERFLEGVRDSSRGLSPAMVLAQDVPRVQSLARHIPTEIHGVLRMFDGRRTLADVLEDSAYRVFETLRVAQRAVQAGLLRVVENQPRRPSWRAILPIERWLVGGEPRDAATEGAPAGAADAGDSRPITVRDARAAEAQQAKAARKRRRRKRRADTTPASAAGAAAPGPAAPEIDWGALVPRIVGAEVGPLAGVVPASHVSGEIVAAPPQGGGGKAPRPEPAVVASEPTVVFDEAAELARDAEARQAEADQRAETADAEARQAAAEHAEAERVETERAAAERAAAERAEAEARADAIRIVAATVSVSSEPARVVQDLELPDTKRERRPAAGAAPPVGDDAGPSAPAEPAPAVVQDSVAAIPSDAITAPVAAAPAPATDEPSDGADPAPAPATDEPSDGADPAPAPATDEPSDGVVRNHIATAETAPVKRSSRHDPVDDDRPGDTTGEITMPRVRPPVVIRYSEPSILVPDLAALHATVAEVAGDQAAAPASPDAASPERDAPVAEARDDAAAFSDAEEAFFRAGHDHDHDHDRAAAPADPPAAESFDDLDEGYRRVGFWARLRGRPRPSRKPDK